MEDVLCCCNTAVVAVLAGTMETGRLRATGYIAAKNLLVPMSCSGTNGHTQVCSYTQLYINFYWSEKVLNYFFSSISSQ